MAAWHSGALGAFFACSALAQCPPDWLPGLPAAITRGDFWNAINFDPDGPGPLPADLVVAGGFDDLAPDSPVAHALARWDGARWNPFVFTSSGGSLVKALTTFDFDGDGPEPARLVVGGRLRLGVGQDAANQILSTSGVGFSRLSDGFNSEVRDLLVFDLDGDGPLPARLFAAGIFGRTGTRAITPVAMWDGSAWQSVGTFTGHVNALEVIDLDGDGPNPARLVAGGRMVLDGRAVHAASFDGAAWTPLGSLDNEVYDFELFDVDGAGPNPPRLCASGVFRNMSPLLNGQAYYNGESWQPIAPVPMIPLTTGRAIKAFDVDGPGPEPARLYMAGDIAVHGAPHAVRIAELREGAWEVLADDDHIGELYNLATVTLPGSDLPSLLALGNYTGPGPTRWPFHIGVVTLTGLEPFTHGLTGPVQVITPTSIRGEPELVILGGDPTRPGFPRISLFDGGSWEEIGDPLNSSTLTAAISGDIDGDGPMGEQIVVAGFIDSIDGVPMQNVGAYDGATWSPLGSLSVLVKDLAFFDPDGDGPEQPVLLATGGSISGGPGTPNYLYRWTGTQWVRFGPEFVSANGPADVSYIAVFDPDADGPSRPQLVVVGYFSRVGAVSAANAAAFDGTTWSPLGSGFTTNPQGVFTWAPNGDGREVVIVTGPFAAAGGVEARGAAIWNGSEWAPLGSGFGVTFGREHYPLELTVFGGDLYAAGNFSEAIGGPGNGIARWNGEDWSPVGAGLDAPATRALGVLAASQNHPETLAVGGAFQSAGGRASAYFAQYAAQSCCPADTNADGVVDSNDFFFFLSRFMSSDDHADFNEDGVIDSRDFFDYVTAYFGTC